MPQKVYDAIVVGSGATGGWPAKVMTEAGFEVLMLEAGSAFDEAKKAKDPYRALMRVYELYPISRHSKSMLEMAADLAFEQGALARARRVEPALLRVGAEQRDRPGPQPLHGEGEVRERVVARERLAGPSETVFGGHEVRLELQRLLVEPNRLFGPAELLENMASIDLHSDQLRPQPVRGLELLERTLEVT